MKRTLAVCVLALGFLGAGAQEAFAQLQIYMRLDMIFGSSTDENHKDWIEVKSLRQVATPDDPKRTACQVEVAKDLDIAGPQLWRAAVLGLHLRNAVIEVVTTGSEQLKIYEIWLDGVTVAGITTAGSNAFVEQVTLAADRARLRYWPQQADGSLGSPVVTQFDCN